MSSSRYPDTNRYPRERSPYRDRRPSTYGSTYPPRGSESSGRSITDSGSFASREVPRGPKSLADAPRGPATGSSSSVPSGPRDGRARGFAGRGDSAPSLRDAPPLTSATHNTRDHNSRDHWRADRDRDRERERDRDFRERRPSPPRRSPIRDSRDFSLNVDRARRNSRDGPPSAGSTYSDPPIGAGSSYRGSAASGIGRGRGSSRDFSGDFRPRGRGYHNDDRDRHHDPRDARDRMYRPRSRSPVRRDRDLRDDRDFDRRDRDDRRFERREDEPRRYDSYIGSASVKSSMRPLDTHRGSVTADARITPGTNTGPSTPHPTHHPGPSDNRTGASADPYSRRSSVATDPQSAKDARRESDRNDLIASRAEFSKERYAPRASSPPAAVPAFGFSNVWRNPALDAKSANVAPVQKPTLPASPASGSVSTSSALLTPVVVPSARKQSIPAGLSTAPPTGPKADRMSDRSHGESQTQEPKPPSIEHIRAEAQPTQSSPMPPSGNAVAADVPELKGPINPPTTFAATTAAVSPPLGPAGRGRPLLIGPQAAQRPNMSPSFSRPQPPPFTGRDASPSAIPSGPRNPLSINTSPKSAPVSIPTGPKADRANLMASRPPMYATPNRSPFGDPRPPVAGGPKSMQWVRPGLNRQSTIPTKREFSGEDRERAFGANVKAPKLEGLTSAAEPQRVEPIRSTVPTTGQTVPATRDPEPAQQARLEAEPLSTNNRRLSDTSMPDASPRHDNIPKSTASSAPRKSFEDSEDDLDLDEDDFVESEAKYMREKALLESKLIPLDVPHLRLISALQELTLVKSLSPDHLPEKATKVVDEEPASPLPVQQPPESTTTELPTPKAEENEDAVMEDKADVVLAPATRALRLRRESSVEREVTPLDLGSLPYLGSGPPTPLSDPDHDHDRPAVPDSVLHAIRNNLQKDIAPERDPEEILTQYATAYRRWRLSIRELDDSRNLDDPERLPSAEPSLKATTPDVQSSAMAAMLDVPPPTTGRRGHSNRFASEFDLEQVIKESLKTAEEERIGKRDREVKRSLWDPEREAAVPLELTAYEARRRLFIDTNFQREPGQGIFVYHYEPPEDDFTGEEHKIMVQHYKDQYAKKWGRLAEILYEKAGTSRTYKDTINHYYATKWGREYKHKARRGRGGGPRKTRGGTARGRGGAANTDRPELTGEDGPLPLTDTGRPRRQAAPTFGTEADADQSGSIPTPARQRRQADVDGAQEKAGRRTKSGKEKGGRKAKGQPLAAAPAASPAKVDRKERILSVKMEEDLMKRQLGELPAQLHSNPLDDQLGVQSDASASTGVTAAITERPRSHTNSRPGPSSYWSVTEQQDFQRNVAHFGTDWAAIANHMGTKTQTMVKNYYARLVNDGSSPDLARLAAEADTRRERGEELGPPPTPTPAPKRRYDNSQQALPRTLAPTPEVAELLKSPPLQNLLPPKFSPPNAATSRFPISQGVPSSNALISAPASLRTETALAAIPSLPPQHSPPSQGLLHQSQLQQTHSKHKQHHPGPRAGYFSDDIPQRMESRLPPSMLPSRSMPQQLQRHVQAPDVPSTSMFRPPQQQEREQYSRLEPQHDHESHPRLSQHTRGISQELPFHRTHQASVSGPGQNAPSIRSTLGVASPENRPLSVSHSRHVSHSQPGLPSLSDVSNQGGGMMGAPPAIGSRPSLGTPPVKEEPRHNHNPPPLSLPQVQSQVMTYQQPTQSNTQPSAPPPAPKAAEPRKSNLLSLLNDTEPEEPRRKKASEGPSHTPTPQQQTPIAPPPPLNQGLSTRRDLFSDASANQSQFPRSAFAQQSLPQSSSSRQIVDLTGEQPGGRQLPRESWQQRQTFHPVHGQAQQSQLNSPHPPLAQAAAFGEARVFANHRSVFAQHNAPHHNPSPPPLSAFSNSPHLHSRTPSLSGPVSQQSRHALGTASTQSVQAAANASQILQPNPYAQVDPPGSGPSSTAPVGMRPSPHLHASHVSQQRDLQGRNEQSQVHNANLPYSNPQAQNDPGQHLRPPNSADQFRSRDPREFHHDFDQRNHDRDMSRELSQRADVLLREQRESLLSRTGQSQQPLQDLRYQPQPLDRGYSMPRPQTPLSRSEHMQHTSLQHPSAHPPAHPPLAENTHPNFGQRPQEDPHRYRDPYGARDDRLNDRIREEQAQQQARMRGSGDDYLSRDRELRERERDIRERELRDARLREDLLRTDNHARLSAPLPQGAPPSQPGQDQRSATMDWTNGVSRHQGHQEAWRR